MKYTKIKDQSDVKLDGIETEVVLLDGNVKSIKFTDKQGSVLLVAHEGGYSSGMSVAIVAPKEKKTIYRVSGIVAGIPISVDLDEIADARSKQRELESSADNVKMDLVEVEV